MPNQLVEKLQVWEISQLFCLQTANQPGCLIFFSFTELSHHSTEFTDNGLADPNKAQILFCSIQSIDSLYSGRICLL